MVDHTHLFHPAYRALKVAAKGHGAIGAIHGLAGNHGPFRTDAPVLWDWGAHDAAMALDLMGVRPDSVDARRIDHRHLPEGLGEVVEIRAGFPGGVQAILRFGNLLPKTRRLVVHLEAAVLVYDDLAEHKLMVHPPSAAFADPGTTGEALPCEPLLPLNVAVGEFASAVRAGSRSLADLDLGVAVVELLARCESALGP